MAEQSPARDDFCASCIGFDVSNIDEEWVLSSNGNTLDKSSLNVSCCNDSMKNSYGFVCIDSHLTLTIYFSFIVTTYIERLKKIVNESVINSNMLLSRVCPFTELTTVTPVSIYSNVWSTVNGFRSCRNDNTMITSVWSLATRAGVVLLYGTKLCIVYLYLSELW